VGQRPGLSLNTYAKLPMKFKKEKKNMI